MKANETICQQFAGRSYLDREFKRAAAAADWDQAWPEIDRDGDLTGRLVGDEDGFLNVGDEAMISKAEARAGGWLVSDGHAEAPQLIDVELAVAAETIRGCLGVSADHPAMEVACQAYHSAVAEALAGDRRARRLRVVSPRGRRLLHSQWCGANFAWTCGAMGVMGVRLNEAEKAAISAADDAGRKAAAVEIETQDAADAAGIE